MFVKQYALDPIAVRAIVVDGLTNEIGFWFWRHYLDASEYEMTWLSRL